MKAIVAVYADWGIGAGGTQPVALKADRRFFREQTLGKTVIVGSRTLLDFPGGKPLPGRTTILLSRRASAPEGALLAETPARAYALAPEGIVIGGAHTYLAMLPYCDEVMVTLLSACPSSDVFFPDLDESPEFLCTESSETMQEDDISYRFLTYRRIRRSPLVEQGKT